MNTTDFFFTNDNECRQIDFVGINLDGGKETYAGKKYYLKPKRNLSLLPYQSDKFFPYDCFSYFTPITDPEGIRNTNFDIRLKNRSSQNILHIMDNLEKNSEGFSEWRKEVLKFSSLPVNSNPDYYYSSLYYLCIVMHKGLPAMYKFHYLTRQCDDTDNISTGRYNNELFYERIAVFNIPELMAFLPIIDHLLKNTDSDLWMVGSDYNLMDQIRKYKLYIKFNRETETEILSVLKKTLAYRGLTQFDDQIDNLCHLQKNSFRLYGLGVCCDSKQNLSLNFYYKH